MLQTLRHQLRKQFAVPYGCYRLASSRRSILKETGWFESLGASVPQSADGDAVPWMNYSVVELIRERLDRTLDLFEYGSGFSTCFFASQAHSVVSVEYDRAWYEQVRQMIPNNASVIYQPFDDSGAYRETIARTERKWDVVVVDGQDRNGCIEVALDYLEPAGVLILDDSDREYYAEGFDRLAAHGFRNLSIAGLKPGSACRHQTTIFYRNENCLKI